MVRAAVVVLLVAVRIGRAEPVPTIPVSEVRPGMKGTGRSVFADGKVEEFQVEVIDVMRRVSPRSDLILCRLSGQGLEESGVIAGMSGSPVYLEGRLAGAVAHAWGFAKQPIAGVTPVGQMLDIWNRSRRPGSSGRRSGPLRPPTTPALSGMSQLPIPVALSGLSPRLTELITPALTEYNLTPVAVAGRAGAVAAADTAALVPGAAVGVSLIDGDVQMAGIGTLTWREGDRILGFGHPMFQAGEVSLPMTGGTIHGVLPSVALSFKFFSPTAPLGTVTEDRLSGIGGRIGPVPPMTPVTIALSSPAAVDTYRFQVARLDELTPLLVAIGLADVVYETEGTLEEVTLASKMTVHFDPAGTTTRAPEPLRLEHVFSDVNPAARLFKSVRDELALLYENRFASPEVSGVEFELRLTSGQSLAYVRSARPDRGRVRPGETVNVVLQLRDHRGEEWEHSTAFTIPLTARDGSISVMFLQPDSFLMNEAMRAPGRTTPASLAHLKELLAETGREDELVVVGYAQTGSVVVKERELPAPPPGLRAVLLANRGDRPAVATSSSILFRQRLKVGRAVSGSARFELEIRR